MGRIAKGAVANPVRLLGRLLDYFGIAGLDPLEGAVQVGGDQENDGSAARALARASNAFHIRR